MAINVGSGQWGLSLILGDAAQGFDASALANRVAPLIQCHYPPMNATFTGYTFPYALVRLDGTIASDANTFLIPRRIDVDNATIGDLSNPQRNAVRNFLNNNFTGYSYTDWDGQTINVPAFNFDAYPLSTPLVELIRALFAYLGNSEYRPRPAPLESHNTEYTDDFSTDPSSRWTLEMGSAPTWDSTNNEYDILTNLTEMLRYSANGAGSIEHESQVTATWVSGGTARLAMAATRFDNTGVNDCYACYLQAGADNVLARYNASSRTGLTSNAFSMSSNDFATVRLATSGAAGANVVCDVWDVNHGSTKPSDPGWYGTDASPDWTYTDTSASRLDDSVHAHCGIAGRPGTGDFDSRHDYFKLRAISDRGGGGGGGLTQYITLLGAGTK